MDFSGQEVQIKTELPDSTLLAEFYEGEELPKAYEKCQNVFKARRDLLDKVCPEVISKNANLSTKMPDFPSVYVNKQRKMMFCAPHKVGSQTWRYFFNKLDSWDKESENQVTHSHSDDFLLNESWPEDISTYSKAFQVGN